MAASDQETDYVCTLSDDLVRIAQEELNEKPEWRTRDIQALREMVKKKPELKIRTDDAYLLRFLRAKKFDYDRAFNLIVKHFTMKADEKNKQLFHDLRPATVRHVLDASVTGVLSHRDRLGRRIIIFRPGKWEPSEYPIDDIFRACFVSLSKLVEEEEAQINGIVLLADLKSMGWKQTRKFKPFYAKRIIHLLQDSFPMRFKGIHYVNEPSIFDYIFAVVRPFMKEKILNRIHFHGNRYEELAEFIDPQYLPAEYGGRLPPFSNEEWTRKLLECDADFITENKYGYVRLPGKHGPTPMCSKDDALDCMAGSYRNKDI